MKGPKPKTNPGFTYLPAAANEWLENLDMEMAVVATRYGGGFIAIVAMPDATSSFDYRDGEEPSLSAFCECLNYEYQTHNACKFLEEMRMDETIAYARSDDPAIAFQTALQMWLRWNKQPDFIEPKVQLSNKERVAILYLRMKEIMKEPIDIGAKYEKIFSVEYSQKILELVDYRFEWGDPDTSYDEDVAAFLKAVHNYLF